MRPSPILLLHIVSGTLGVLAGFVAVFLLKGSRRHGFAGKIFVISMMSLALSGAYMAMRKSEVTNVLGGALTFYLVTTAWLTVSRKVGQRGIFDWLALFLGTAVGVTEVTFGMQALLSQTGTKFGYPAAIYFVFGCVALLGAAGDIRVLVRGGISGPPRLARHLWRMCFALFIGSASIFLARPQLFPALMQKTGLLFVLTFLPLALMIFWLIRVRFANAFKNKTDTGVNGRARAVETFS